MTPPADISPSGLRPASVGLGRIRLVVLGLLLVGFIVGITGLALAYGKALTPKTSVSSVSANYNVASIPLGDLLKAGNLTIDAAGSLSVNGQLRVNGGLVLDPVTRPAVADSSRGQLYYDQNDNHLRYFDGGAYVDVLNGTDKTTFGGAAGNFTVGQGLTLSNGQLSSTIVVPAQIPGVTSLQGQTGAVTLTSGGGISIAGTTVNNTGVTAFGGATGSIGVGAGLAVTGGTLVSTGANSIASGSGTLTVTQDGSGNYTISEVGSGTGGTVALGPVAAQGDAGTNPSIWINKTGAGNLLQLSTGVVPVNRFVVDNGGAIIAGTIGFNQVTAKPNFINSLDTATGDLLLGTGLTRSGQTISNNGTLSVGGLAGTITLGTGLAVTAGQLVATGSGVGSITGTTNQIIVTGSGALTLSLPQDIATTSTPTFANINLSSPLSVTNGGTGAASFTANRLLVSNGAGALTAVASGGAGMCLTSTAGAPVFAACPGSGGVSSVNGGTGAITVAGTSAGSVTTAGNAILLNDATTAIKGLASFSGTNFSVVGGSVNTIQGISATATPTFGGLNLTAALSVTNGGTGATTPGAARINFGAAALGVNNDITSLTGVSSIGTTATALALQGSDSTTLSATKAGLTTTIGFATPGANVTYLFQSAAAGTYGICTTVGNCSGVGGGVTTPGGTPGKLAKFSGGQSLTDSLLSEAGAIVTVNGTLAANTMTRVGGVSLITVPNAAGTLAVSASGPLSIDASGNIACASCLTSGGGGSGGVSSVNGMNSAILVAGTANQLIVTNNGGTGTVTLSLPQNIATTSTPTFAGLNLTGALGVASGGTGLSALPANGQLLIGNSSGYTLGNIIAGTGISIVNAAGSITAAVDATVCRSTNNCGYLTGGSTVNLQATTPGAAQSGNINVTGAIIAGGNVTAGTFDNLTLTSNPTGFSIAGGTTPKTLTLAADATINQDLSTTSNPSFNGLTLAVALPVTSGGTGSNSASGARTNLGAAASGANGDITSLGGLTTALSVAQGGTGTSSLTQNGVIIGQGTAATTSLVAGSTGQCLISTAGAPTWQACPGGGGVTSINSASGAITLAGTAIGSVSTVGGLITINDASATTKGLASFSATNFTVTAGTVDTIQNIGPTASPTFTALALAGTNSLTLGTASTSTGQIKLYNAASTGSVTLQTAPSVGNWTLGAPAMTANDTLCLQTLANCSGAAGAAGGDLTGNYPNPTIAKLQGSTLTISAPASGQVLNYNGSAWVNTGSPTLSGDLAVQGAGVSSIATQLRVGAAASYNTFATGGVFAAKVDYPTGTSPSSVTTADVNGDGKTDLIVANNTGSNISVFIGTGNGTFAAKVDYPTVGSPFSVIAADFNGDGKPDLAVSNAAVVSVFINNGNGTFAAKADYFTGTTSTFVTSADFNGDGKLDLAVSTVAVVSVFINNGNGTFAAKVDYPTGTGPFGVTSADFNGDGKPDLAVANNSSATVSVFINNGNGTFAAKVDYSTSSAPFSVTAADFNGDGKLDLAVANYSSNSVSVLINTGNGTFAAKVDYPTGTGPRSVTAADVNGDGKADLILANNGTNNVSVFIGTGTGTFTAKVDYPTGMGSYSVSAADFNGDGRPDLAVANLGSNTVSVLINGANPLTVTAGLSVKAPTANQSGLIIQGANTQAVDYVHVQDASGVSLLTLDKLGNLGIGPNVPLYKLDVSGDINTSGAYRVNGVQMASSSLADVGNLAKLNVTQTFTGNNTFSGAVTAATSVLTPLLDTATAVPLNIGTTNATSINLNENTIIATGKTFTANGTGLFKSSVDSTTAFQVQNAAGNSVLTVDTSAKNVVVGKASTVNGAIVLQNGTNANTVTIQSGVTTTSYALTLPATTSGIAGDCLKDITGTGVLGFGTCVAPGGGGASAALDNLAGVAINVSLLPAVSGAIDLGSPSKTFNNAYLNGLTVQGAVGTANAGVSVLNVDSTTSTVNIGGTAIANQVIAGQVTATKYVGGDINIAPQVSDQSRYIWSAATGWIDIFPVGGGMKVYNEHLEGYVWSQNIGWIRLGTATTGAAYSYANTSSTDYGVNRNTTTGALSGYAWSTTAGWINFSPTNGGVTHNSVTGTLTGYAWGDNIGWINFNGVAADTTPYQASITFGTGSIKAGDIYGANAILSGNATVAGMLGVGTVSPAYKLDVQDSQATNYVAKLTNTNTGPNAGGLLIDLGIANASRTAGNYFIGFSGSGVVSGKIQGGADAVAYSTSGADYAEYFKAKPDSLPQVGELVMLDAATQGVARAAGSSSPLVGVVSTSPGFVGNGPACKVTDNNCEADYAKTNSLVALSGQVPTKVNTSNGAIVTGDPITASTTPGVGAKATSADFIVGYALEPLTAPADAAAKPATATIKVLIRPQRLSVSDSAMLQSASMKLSGGATIGGDVQIGGKINVAGAATLTDVVITGNATITGSLAVRDITVANLTVSGHIITSGDTPTITVQPAAGVGSTATVEGNDASGAITITTGPTSAPTEGNLAELTFSTPYSKPPRVMLTPEGPTSASVTTFIVSGTTSIKFGAYTKPQPNKVYEYYYYVVQ